MMALLDGGNEVALADGLDVQPLVADALAVLVRRRFAVARGQVSDDVLVAFERAVFLVVAIEEAAGGASDDADVGGAELGGVAVAPSLFDRLVEFGVADRFFLAFDDGEGPLAFVVVKHDDIRVIVW